MKMLLNIQNYETRVRPVLQENKPIFIRHGLTLKDISDVVSLIIWGPEKIKPLKYHTVSN